MITEAEQGEKKLQAGAAENHQQTVEKS